MNTSPDSPLYIILSHPLAPAGMALIWLLNGLLTLLIGFPFWVSLFFILTAVVSFWLTEQAQKRL